MKIFKNYDPAQRRSAGNIIKFLAILLAFTIVARGTSGATLARVILATPDRSEIIDAISGIATVSSTDTLEITAPEGLRIAEMLVGVGQYVRVGDPVAVFEMDDLEEMRIRENANLSRMNLDLEKLGRGESIDGDPLERAQRDHRRAQEDYAIAVKQGEADISRTRETLDLLVASHEDIGMLPTAILNHQRALEDYYTILAQGQADIAAAEEALRSMEVDDTALQNAIRNHERVVDDYNRTRAEVEANIAEAQEALDEIRSRRPSTADRSALDIAERNYRRARDDYNAARQAGEESVQSAEIALHMAIAAYQDAVLASQLEPNHAAVAAAWAEVERTQNAITTAQNTAESNILAAARRLEDEATRLAQAQRTFNETTQGELEQAETNLEAAETQAESRLLTASRSLEDSEKSLYQAQRTFENNKQAELERLENALETAKERAARDLQTAVRTLEDRAGTINSEIRRAQTDLQTAISNAESSSRTAARQVETTAAALRTAERSHQQTILQNADTAAQNIISVATLQLDIAAQQSTMDKLDILISNDGVLYANYSGAVSIAMQTGNTTSSAPIVTLRDTQGGFEAQLQITQSQAERLAIGNEAEVTTGGGSTFFTPTTIGIVSGISQPDENDYVTVTISLPEGNWSIGQRIDAQVILHRANYDFSVPISALHSDNAGYFLHVMEQRSTVLGLQNVVVRINVEIVAADDMMVSVRGPVSRSSQVIVGSNKAISVGDRIRVSE